MLNRNRLAAAALLALGAAFATAVQAVEICKWIDRDGAVHYSDVPLAGRPCVERISIRHPDPLENVRAQERRAELLRRLEQTREEEARSQASQSAQASRAAQRAQRCSSAREELRFLKEAEGLRLLRPGKEGEEPAMVWLDDAQREALIEAWRLQVQAWCETASQEPEAPPRALAVPPPAR
ncbi:DUF4124 domain-containing protein [Caldimonas sp. KR1-144]|uniref:DUF4124 domain-containing protein n=1 Tax=Caldimonas sp. KR1-144 TaxID=3400911 RepID=UPI003C0E298D